MPGRHGPSTIHSPSDPSSTPVYIATDTDELRAAGSAMYAVADDVATMRGKGMLTNRAQWPLCSASDAAARFADRFDYLLQQLGTQVDTAGTDLRGTADAFEEAEAMAAAALDDDHGMLY
jgi:hypothetical protein